MISREHDLTLLLMRLFTTIGLFAALVAAFSCSCLSAELTHLMRSSVACSRSSAGLLHVVDMFLFHVLLQQNMAYQFFGGLLSVLVEDNEVLGNGRVPGRRDVERGLHWVVHGAVVPARVYLEAGAPPAHAANGQLANKHVR